MPPSPPSRVAETTPLTPAEEMAFRDWVARAKIRDVDHPQSYYDYRGYWKATGGAGHRPGEHFPDTFKQHGHPTFSQESQYSRGAWDGGLWLTDDIQLTQSPLAVSHGVGSFMPLSDLVRPRKRG